MSSPVIETTLPRTEDRTGREIAVGSRVRSFDFPFAGRDLEGAHACFVEGEVVGVERSSFDCPRYALRPTRRVFGGEETELPDEMFFPPLNGTQSLLGGTTDGVEVID